MKNLINFSTSKLSNNSSGQWLMRVVVLTILILASAGTTKAINYLTVNLNNHSDGQILPYCQVDCDSIKYILTGVTISSWASSGAPQTMHGDTLVLPTGFSGSVTCFYSGGQKGVISRPVQIPPIPTFSSDTVCGVETITLNAGYNIPTQFFTYVWSDASITPTITVGSGMYSVSVTNACGTVNHTATIMQYNPNHPNLGPDLSVCQGSVVTLNPGSGYSNLLWSPGGATTPTLSPTASGDYAVQTTNAIGGCIDNDTIHIEFLVPYDGEKICYVTKGFSSNLNEITFDQTLGEGIVKYNVKKESSITGVYTLVEQADHTGPGNITVIDSADNGTIQYKYNITIIDSCGNESPLGGMVKPIFSTLSVNEQGTYNMHLLQYYDENNPAVPATTYIFSGNSLPLMLKDSIAGGITDYIVPTSNTDSIFAAAVILPCGGTKSMNIAFSNRVTKGTAVGIKENVAQMKFDVFPNPVADILHVSGDNIVSIEIYDMVGSLILSSNEKNIKITAPAGMYIIKASNESQQYAYMRFIKL